MIEEKLKERCRIQKLKENEERKKKETLFQNNLEKQR